MMTLNDMKNCQNKTLLSKNCDYLPQLVCNFASMAHFLESHHNEHLILKEELLQAQKEISTLQENVANLQNQIQDLNLKLSRMEQLLMLSDLVRMFRFYISHETIPDWGAFVETLLEWKADLEERKISEDEYQNNLQPFNNLFGADACKLVTLVQERNGNAHDDIRSAPHQDKFLTKFQNTKFCEEFQPFVDELVRQLAPMRKERINKTKDVPKK